MHVSFYPLQVPSEYGAFFWTGQILLHYFNTRNSSANEKYCTKIDDCIYVLYILHVSVVMNYISNRPREYVMPIVDVRGRQVCKGGI